ncbi:MAG: hypothetical protein ABMB14_34260 [Myxococcota bacterium]
MGEMITKPDANPVLLAVLNLFGIPIGYFLMGQQKKAIAGFVYCIILWTVTCGTLGWIVSLLFAYDAYLLGQKLASGESISDTQNELAFLNNLPGFK